MECTVRECVFNDLGKKCTDKDTVAEHEAFNSKWKMESSHDCNNFELKGEKNFEEQKIEASEKFVDKILPYCTAGNSAENLKLYLNHEVKEFYSSAFGDGQENVLKERL